MRKREDNPYANREDRIRLTPGCEAYGKENRDNIFPYEEYKAAIDAESAVRRTGVSATVINAERDENVTGHFLLGVTINGSCDEGLFEEGSVQKDGVSIGDIVSSEGRPDPGAG